MQRADKSDRCTPRSGKTFCEMRRTIHVHKLGQNLSKIRLVKHIEKRCKKLRVLEQKLEVPLPQQRRKVWLHISTK